MPGLITTQGKQRIGVQASQATSGAGPTYNVARQIQTFSLDDGAGTILAAHDDCTDAGAITNFIDRAMAVPTRAAQTISHTATFITTEGNFTIRKVCMHDDVIANVTATSLTLMAGFDTQSIVGTADFTKQFTQDIAFS